MSELNKRDRELVAIGASIASNCVPCIAYHVGKARETGLSDAQIEAAVAIAEQIRSVPAELVVNTARAHLNPSSTERRSTEGDCSSKCGC